MPSSPINTISRATTRDHKDASQVRENPSQELQSQERRLSRTLKPKDAFSFLDLLGDLLRLQEQTVAMSFAYMHHYRRFLEKSSEAEAVPDFLDSYTLALASLSLATKSTESPRRLRALLVPAYHLLNPQSPRLTFPSDLYDTLRSTLVTSELHLLRILRFELRLKLPLEYAQSYLGRAISVVEIGEDYDNIPRLRMDEDRVLELMDTSIGREVSKEVVEAVKMYDVFMFFEMRTIALACVWRSLKRRGVVVGESIEDWVKAQAGSRATSKDISHFVEDVIEAEEEIGRNWPKDLTTTG